MSRDFNGTTSTIGIIGASGGQVNSWTSNTPFPFSVLAWIQADGLGESSSGRIIGCENPGGAGTGFWNFQLRAPATMQFQIDYSNPGNIVSQSTYGSINTSGNVWQHVAATWVGVGNSVGALKLYINASETAYTAQNTSSGIFNSNTHQALVLGNAGNTAQTFDGRIAHVHIFRRVLSVGEIRHLMQHPAGFASMGSISSVGTTSLLGYWSLGGFSGNEPDFSGNARVGTITTVVIGSNNPPVNEQFIVGYPMGAMAM